VSARRLLIVTGIAVPLFLLAGAWLYAMSGGWRLLAAAILALLFWALALREQLHFLRERRHVKRLRL
jgi:hypothetical protein